MSLQADKLSAVLLFLCFKSWQHNSRSFRKKKNLGRLLQLSAVPSGRPIKAEGNWISIAMGVDWPLCAQPAAEEEVTLDDLITEQQNRNCVKRTLPTSFIKFAFVLVNNQRAVQTRTLKSTFNDPIVKQNRSKSAIESFKNMLKALRLSTQILNYIFGRTRPLMRLAVGRGFKKEKHKLIPLQTFDCMFVLPVFQITG